MTGTIQVGEGRGWSVSTGLFLWVVDTLVDEAPPEVGASVRRSCAVHPGRLDLEEFPPEQRHALSGVLRALPTLARERLPITASRSAVLAMLDDICTAA